MTKTSKEEIINKIMDLLMQLVNDTEVDNVEDITDDKPVQMLTVKECTEIVSGLSEHTVRKLIAHNKLKYIRTGEGKRGKILVNKADLLKYFE